MQTWPIGVERRLLDIVDSTNAESKRTLAEIQAPTWIMSKFQTSGRGRQGRPWIASLGNFTASLVIKVEDVRTASLRTYVASLALRDACVELVGRPRRFTLKWPNDLLLNNGKLAGILLECITTKNELKLIIGFGVNLAIAPNLLHADVSKPVAVSLTGETGVVIKPEEFLLYLANSFQYREEQLQKEGFCPIREDWLEYAVGIGDYVTVRTFNREIYGKFINIDEDGNALLLYGGKEISVSAGEMLSTAGEVNAPDH